MKKYLINGALALLAGAFVVSCSEKESDFVPLAQQKLKDYDEVFKQLYGEIDPYQDWGFGSGKVEIDPNDSSVVVEVVDLDGNAAITRRAPFGGMFSLLAFNNAKTRTDANGAGENKNLNEWGDPAKNGGTAYDVPDALTEGQKLRAYKYFQTHPNLTYKDPGYTTFFVQQVYKGGTDPYPGRSTERYTLGSGGDPIVGSEHMDHLTFGLKSDGTALHHVNDFNKGDWNLGEPYEVLNTGCSANDYVNSTTHVEGKTHPDKITLMVNSGTQRVGYAESNASVQHNYCCALAGAAVIDAWANDPANYVNGEPIGEDVDDKWHRSFVGLDYEANEDPYYKVNNQKVAAKIGDAMPNNLPYAWTGTQYVVLDDALKSKTLKEYFNLDEEVYYLQTEKNKWAGTADNYPSQSSIVKKAPKSEIDAAFPGVNANETTDVLDLTKIKDKLDAHRIPVYGKGFQEWYYGIGARDYYFTDWIVTLTNAGPAPETNDDEEEYIDEWKQIEKGRVFCEDLGRATREDLDFNDVVFDAIIFSNHTKYTKWKVKKVNGHEVSRTVTVGPNESTHYYANVTILAAGGTIPVTIQSNIANGASFQVHSQFNPVAPVDMMVNTRDNNSTAFGSYDVRNAVEIGTFTKNFKAEVTNEDGTKSEQTYTLKLFEINPPSTDENYIKEIQIWSSFGQGTQVSELEHEKGGAPQKFMVPLDTKWTSERKNISLAYPGFDAWVQNRSNVPDWANPVSGYFYDGTNGGKQLPLVMKARTSYLTGREVDLWTGSQTYSTSWTLANMNGTLSVDKFYAGDRLRFYGENIGDEAWITVVVGGIQPYFIDSNFPNYVVDSDGKQIPATTGFIEVLLDDASAELLNNEISTENNAKKVPFQVQGRGFTLTRICRVEF